MLDKTKRDNRVKVLRGKLQKVALNLNENVKYNMTNFMKRPEAQKTRFEKELWGDMLATNSKDKMQLLTNLEATRDDKILERDEDGDIVDSLGDTRGTALVHSFSEDKPHGIVSPIDKQEQEYQQTKLLMKQTADGKPPRMTQERATRTLDDIEKGNARKSRRPVDSTYKFKLSKSQRKLQKMAVRFTSSFGPDWDAIDAFKSKEKYLSKKFESTGNELKLNGHVVARHHKDGIEVSNAGHDTNKTYSTIKGLGIHARNQKGITKLNNKVIDVNSGEFVLVPHKDISDKPITYTKTKPQKRYRSVGEQSKFRDLVEKNEASVQGRKGKLPLSQISIQPKDQKQINKITGVKSPIGKEILGVEAHHILSHKKNKGLATNPNNGIMIPKQDHKMLTSFAKLQRRLQKMAVKSDINDRFEKSEKALDFFADIFGEGGPKEPPKASPYPLPKYFEKDYEAFHNHVQDSAFRFEDAQDAGIDIEEFEGELQGTWKDLSEPNKGLLRNHYQKHLSKELPWQKNPKLYTSGKIPDSENTYVQPGFHKNLKPMFEHDPDSYKEIDPSDIKPKFPKPNEEREKTVCFRLSNLAGLFSEPCFDTTRRCTRTRPWT